MTAFNPTYAAAEAMCGETFRVDRGTQEFPAVSIEDLGFGKEQVVKGGRIEVVSVELYVRKAVIAQAGIEGDTFLSVGGKRVRVVDLSDVGSDVVTIRCGPAGVTVR